MTPDPRDLRFVVVGAYAADCLVTTPRLPSWGDDLEARSIRTMPGGKALNQAIALARLGAQITTVGTVGDDALGRDALDLLTREGIDTSGIQIRQNTPTPVCLCLIGEDSNTAYLAHTPADIIVTPDTIRAATSAFERADTVLATFEAQPEAITEAIHTGHQSGSTVIVQPAPNKHPYQAIADLPWSKVDVLVPNQTEARVLLPEDHPARSADSDSLTAALAEHLHIPHIVVTLAEHGCLAHHQGTSTHYPAHLVPELADTTGASDAFTAALALHLTLGTPQHEAIHTALTAAALAIGKHGGYPSMPTAAALNQAVAS